MTDLTPVPVVDPTKTVVADFLPGNTRDVELVLRMGWETTRDGLLLPVALMTVRHEQ